MDSYILQEPAKENIAELSEILKKYEDTNIMFAGHTDNTGSVDYNQQLSEKRAKSVAKYTSFLDINSSRMTIIGYGEERPEATNKTEAGRQRNRRVEIAIYANDELKEAAKDGELEQSR
ncbi:MAG: OmpA family protein [Fodinibius sp.]|nr:OmpA family protein [Fodinibius sp.]